MHTWKQHHPTLRRAIKKAGSVSALARFLGISRQAIYYWYRVPAKYQGDVTRLLKRGAA